jgi:RRXRR protein
MTKVFILDADKQPLYPIRISHARLLLSQGKAAVFQRYPFTIILK